ncbi:hypothetical protein ACTXJC_10265 [Glutamicibacter ardleyensis]
MTEEEYAQAHQNLMEQRRKDKPRLEALAITELVPDAIYELVDRNGNTEKGEAWGTTPDGEGMVWYKTKEACEDDFLDGGDYLPHVAMTEAQFEAMRYSPGNDDM